MQKQARELNNAKPAKNAALQLAEAKALLEKDASNHSYHLLIGDAYANLMEYQQALVHYKDARDIEPMDIAVWKKTAIAYAKLGLWDEAIGSFKAAINIDDTDPLLRGLLAWAMWHSQTQYPAGECIELMEEALEAGANFSPIQNVLVDHFLTQATASWPLATDGTDLRYATKREHITAAKQMIARAKVHVLAASDNMKQELRCIENEVVALEERAFHGYPFVRRAPIIAGIVFLLLGATGLSLFLFLLAVLYHFSQRKPRYLANRDYVEGNYGDPFWVKTVNSILGFFSSFTFFSSSIFRVVLWSWAFWLLSQIIKHSLVIVLLPILVLAGFYVNYDVFNRIKSGAAKIPLQRTGKA